MADVRQNHEALKREFDGAIVFYRQTKGGFACYYDDAEYMEALTGKQTETECGRKVFRFSEARLAGYEDAAKLHGRRVIVI